MYYKLQNFLFQPLYGLTNTMVPIIGYNLGAKQPERVRGVLRSALSFSTVIMLAGAVLFSHSPKRCCAYSETRHSHFPAASMPSASLPPLFLAAGIVTAFAGALQGLGRSCDALPPDRPAAAYHPAACCFSARTAQHPYAVVRFPRCRTGRFAGFDYSMATRRTAQPDAVSMNLQIGTCFFGKKSIQ